MKRDIKYIIKRIIIGVGIAVILGMLKTNNVFADSPIDITLNAGSTLSDYSFSTSQCSYYCAKNFNYNNINFTSTAPLLDEYIPLYFYSSTLNVYYNYYINLLPNSNDSLDISFTNDYVNVSVNGTDNISYYNNPNSPYSKTALNYFLLDNLSNSNTIKNYINSNYFNNNISYDYITSSINNSNYYILSNSENANVNIPFSIFYENYLLNNNFQLVYYDSRINSLTINNQEIDLPITPSGYSEITLSKGQSAYFVPKNYNDIQIETIDNVNYIDFNYYYKGNVKEGWFPLQNINDLFINNEIPFISESSFELRDSFFPMYENPEATGYNYYAYIIINNNVDNSYIRYNSILFDSYIIDDFTTYNNKVCYIDRTSQQMCQDIDFATLINNYWLDGFNDNNDGFVGEQGKPTNKLSDLFNALKYPINWLTNLINSNSCQSINLPLPFVGGNVKLVCLSSIFKSVLGNYYNIFLYVITGIYAYRITIMNIDTATDVLDPTDDKLEVIEL